MTMDAFKEFSKNLLLSVAVTCFTIGASLLKAGEFEMGAVLVGLGIALLLVTVYIDNLWKKSIEEKVEVLRKRMEKYGKAR